MALKAAVISSAVLKSAVFLCVIPSFAAALNMCVSTGMMSFRTGTPSQPPGSTSSLRTIQRSIRQKRLQALPSAGEGSRNGILEPAHSDSSSTNPSMAPLTV